MSGSGWQGTFTALVTPFTADGEEVDWDAFDRLLELQLSGGLRGLVPCGTTGEAPTLSAEEQVEIVRRTVQKARGKALVVAGTGSNDTKKTVRASERALEAGADAVMLVNPYYNKPSQEGMFQHFRYVAEAVQAPVILYNIPSRTSVTLSAETTARLADACPNIVAVKDATGSVLYCQDVLSRVGDRLTVLSGDDPLTLPLLSVGAKGVISVTANLLPERVAEVVDLHFKGLAAEARVKNQALFPIHGALFSEPNPQPIKAALAMRNLIQAAVRLPLVPASEKCRALIGRVLAEYEARCK
jgi:4-hydroxy-tetrahydrodipicolinate synthase